MKRRPDFPAWPDFRITVRPLVWHWRLKPWFYADDVDGLRGHWTIQWLAITVEWWGPTRSEVMFPTEDIDNGGAA